MVCAKNYNLPFPGLLQSKQTCEPVLYDHVLFWRLFPFLSHFLISSFLIHLLFHENPTETLSRHTSKFLTRFHLIWFISSWGGWQNWPVSLVNENHTNLTFCVGLLFPKEKKERKLSKKLIIFTVYAGTCSPQTHTCQETCQGKQMSLSKGTLGTRLNENFLVSFHWLARDEGTL